MPKFTKTEAELETHFDKWLYVLKNLEKLNQRPEKLQEKVFAKLFKQAQIASYTEEEYNEYENSLKIYRDLKNSMDTAFGDGEKKGLVKGKEIGLAKGKIEGKIEIAINLKKAGFEIKAIAQATGLTEQEIENL